MGMYEYDETTGLREGGLMILDSTNGSVLSEITGTDRTGILDVRWIGSKSLAACTAEGGIQFFTVAEDGKMVECSSTIPMFTGEGAKGVAIGLDVTQGCLSPDGTLLATGGDDRRMKLWDVRTPATDGPVLSDRREHEAGITAYLFVQHGRRILTGSYDENVRVWDLRFGVADSACDASGVQCVVRQAAIGGVWRLKPSLTGKDLLIAGCYGGCEVWPLEELLDGREAERIGECCCSGLRPDDFVGIDPVTEKVEGHF
ncbi:g-protein beta wd-40 repeats containing protein, putative [Perkinsus marinus ATCC 50983]|uniref:methylated diphthine methylhydrolase n=1 Tax=Perkinsus marinus (strain ATCC 50983 / TXsc) TaxID=423536 RepID=C5LGM0_PERM5|nr:g-protein beta wd-40 repeats containing protein, putative [Perkinsus marinus ATCC 50983]EER04123.1 g-protein beta wd-40 repeats containing protein, putative [Perkinsus marinus ATCC 50983]|eukprot:XP_002772307.1 g-protein beta wd-40 repeats containing protein, putative [Perkinsus marinus ATCC 50983]